MIRISPNGVLAAIALMCSAFMAVTPAAALTKEEIFKRCTANVQEEFGEAAVEFRSIRRTNDKEWAFGELEMTDGSKRRIRCQIQNRRKVDVKFPKVREGAADSPWTDERPANAGFIERKDDEKPDDENASDQDAEGEEDTNRPRRLSVEEKPDPAEGTSTDDAQAGQNDDAAGQTDPDQAAQSDAAADEAQAGEDEKPAEEEPSGPVFRKVVTQ